MVEELNDKAREINKRLNSLPLEEQGVVASYSSFFLEGDVHDEYLRNPAKMQSFKEELTKHGLSAEAITLAMEMFGFTSDNGSSNEQ